MSTTYALFKAKVRGAGLQYINTEALHLHSSVNLELCFALGLKALRVQINLDHPATAPTAQAIHLE